MLAKEHENRCATLSSYRAVLEPVGQIAVVTSGLVTYRPRCGRTVRMPQGLLLWFSDLAHSLIEGEAENLDK